MNKIHCMNGNSKMYVLNSIASDSPISKEGDEKRRNVFTMRLDTINVCQNPWYKLHGIKRSLSTNIKICSRIVM